MSKKNDEMMTGVKVQKSRTDKIFDFFLYTISTIIVIVMLYPMYFIVIASFSNPADVSAGNIVLLPKGITFKGYQKLLEYSQLWVGYKNTILYAALGTVIFWFPCRPSTDRSPIRWQTTATAPTRYWFPRTEALLILPHGPGPCVTSDPSI